MDSTALPKPPRRRYTVSDQVLAANRVKLAKARGNPNTPARRRARLRNLEKAWARQRDPQQIPGGPFLHGACSQDLRRTAPLAGEAEGELDGLLDRLLALFRAPLPYIVAGVRYVGERLWRVRRVLQSRVHRERLAFYQALFEAAEEPGGMGLERVERLAVGLARALDLRQELHEGYRRTLARLQQRLRGALRALEEDARPYYPLLGESPRRVAQPRRRRSQRRGPAPLTEPTGPTGLGTSLEPERLDVSSEPEGLGTSLEQEPLDASSESEGLDASLEQETLDASPEPEGLGASLEPKQSDVNVEPSRLDASLEQETLDASPEPSGLGTSLEPERLDVSPEPEGLDTSLETARLARKESRDATAWMNWLLRQFARHHWVLPSDRDGERLHGWLVRAAVVGGDNVRGAFSPRLEGAIVVLAKSTWWRLEQGREDWSEVLESFERGIQIENPDRPLRLAADREEEAEAAAWSPEERRLAERVLPAYQAKLTMGLVALPWLNLDPDVPLRLIELWNDEVRKAIERVALAVAEAVDAQSGQPAAPLSQSGEGESGQPAAILSGPAPTLSGESGPLNQSGESGPPGPGGESGPSVT